MGPPLVGPNFKREEKRRVRLTQKIQHSKRPSRIAPLMAADGRFDAAVRLLTGDLALNVDLNGSNQRCAEGRGF